MQPRREALKHLQDLQKIRLDGLRFRIVDAKGQVVGRLAEQISIILQGKDKPTYNPRKDQGDVVIVTNAAHVHLAHDKWDTKLYRWHTGYPGGLKARTARELWEKDPTKVLWNAVNGMLPKNKTREVRLDKLKIFPEEDHPFGQLPLVPYVPAPRHLRDKGIGYPLPDGFEPVNPERYRFRWMTSAQLRSRAARPEVAFDDLLTEEERRALAAAAPQPAAAGKAAATASGQTANQAAAAAQQQRPQSKGG